MIARALLVVALLGGTAAANPRPLPFSYPYETLLAGKLEIEQYLDFVPVRVARENPDGTLEGVFSNRSVLQTEIEYGLTDHIEVSWYFVFQQGASADTPFLRFQGVKQRARMRFAEAGEWPVDVGIYLELAEFHDEIEFEEKILLSKRFGRWSVVANLWVEQEYYFQVHESKFIYNPTAGFTYEISPKLTVGLEYWSRGRFDDPDDDVQISDAPSGARHYAGPTMLVQKDQVFLGIGAYLRLDHLGDNAVVDDPFGKMWFRAVLGIEL